MKNQPKKIYVSSTYSDLKNYRAVVYKNLRGSRYDVIAMEDYSASPKRATEKCLEDVASCDIYIGIFAWRYGYIPKEHHDGKKSITELEYRKARQKGIPTLIFLLDPTAPWAPDYMDSHTKESKNGALIKKFRKELMEENIVSFFANTDELSIKIMTALFILDAPTDHDTKQPSDDVQSDIKQIFEDDLHELLNIHYFGVVSYIDMLNEWTRRKNYQKVEELLPNVLANSRTVLSELQTMRNTSSKRVFEADSMLSALQKMTMNYGFSLGLKENPISIDCPTEINLPIALKNSLLRIASSAIMKAIESSKTRDYSNANINIAVNRIDNIVNLIVTDNVNLYDEKEHEHFSDRMKRIIFQLTEQKMESHITFISSEKGMTVSVKVIL